MKAPATGPKFHLDCTDEPGICDPVDGGGAEGGPGVVIPARVRSHEVPEGLAGVRG